jgi:hypothetical protein
MKKNHLLLLVVFLSSGLFANNLETNNILKSTMQSDEKTQGEFVIFPLSFFVSGLEFGYEHPIKHKRTLRLSAGYFYLDKPSFYSSRLRNMEGIRTEFQYRFYGEGFNAKNNYFIAPFGVFRTIKMDYTPHGSTRVRGVSSQSVIAGFVIGYRYRIIDFISLEVHAGGGITPTSIGDYDIVHLDMVNPYRKSINAKAGFTFGIRF